MWRHKQPGFALRLLCELQKQQQCSLHCDTLLQTEGISIPAHSCVLSALSPVFCRAFAKVPSLPVGQSRLIQLEAVGAHALMKLVGFMYSGEMEGESLAEQQEVIDIAYRLGFSNFMNWEQKQVNRDQIKTASWREIGLQTEETEGRKKDASIQILSEKQSFSHSGTQTDNAKAHFADTCIASEPELSVDLPDELTDVPSKYNSISPECLAWIDEVVAHSLSDSAEALVRVRARRQQTQKTRAKISKKQGGTQISLKIKMKRERSGALWEIVSIQEESTVDRSKTCGSSDAPPMTHSLAETHKSSVEVQLSSSPSLACQNLETVTLTPPSELTTPLPATPIRPLSEHFCLQTPHPIPLSSSLQMQTLSPSLSQPEESDDHIAKLLEMVAMGLNILPSVTVVENSSMHAQLDQKLEKFADVANSPAPYLCLLGRDLGAMGPEISSGISEQREAGTEDLSSCRKWDLKDVASVASYPTSVSRTSPGITQKKTSDFSEMRLPRCLSPLTSEAGKTTGISTQDPLRPLEFSSCHSVSHVNLQPALRYTSSPIQPQALPGKSNQQNPSCTSLHVNGLHFSVVGKDSYPLRPNREHNGEVSEFKSVEQKTKMPDSENDLLKGTEDKILDRQMNESVIRRRSVARYSVETENEPHSKKAKMAGYQNGIDTQTVKEVNPCSVKINNISHIDNIQGTSSPVTSDEMDYLKAAKTRKIVSIDMKSQENLALHQICQNFKCEGQEACQKYVWDTKQPTCLVTKPLQKRACTKALKEDLSKMSKLNSSSAVLNALSSSSHHDLQLSQMRKECEARHESERPPNVQRPLGLAQTITKLNDLTSECEKNKAPGTEMENPIAEPETIIPAVNLNRDENKQPKMHASLATKTRFCDKIFHQSVFRVGITVTQGLPVNHHPRSVLQTTDRNIRTSLPPILTCKKLSEPPEVESSPRNVKGRFGNGNFVREAESSTNTGLSVDEVVDLNSHLCTILPARDSNNNFGMDNNLQHESTTLQHLFRPENMMEKPTTDEQIPVSLCEVPISNAPTEIKLIKTKELHIKGTESIQVVNLEGQEVWNKEKEKENTVRKTDHVEIGRMNEYDIGISDIEMDESAQLPTDHGNEVVATGGNADDKGVEESQMSVEMDDVGDDAHEEEFNGQRALSTDVEVMPSDEATVEKTSGIMNTEASSIQCREEPDLSSSSVDILGLLEVFLPDVSAESAEDCSSAEEELVVDDISDSPVQSCTVAGIICNTILEEKHELRVEEEEENEEEEVRRREEKEEEEEVDVTGEESN